MRPKRLRARTKKDLANGWQPIGIASMRDLIFEEQSRHFMTIITNVDSRRRKSVHTHRGVNGVESRDGAGGRQGS